MLIALPSIDEPTIQFNDTTVVKYQPEFQNGIRESVYYNSLQHPHIIHTDMCEFIKYTRPQYKDMVYDGMKITFPRYVPVDAIATQMTPERVERLFEQIADALAYLEENDILQSDVKEQNIYYDGARDAYILADFDLAFYTTECFINRVATPTTRPPELAQASLYRTEYRDQEYGRRRKHLKEALSTTKGDVFSLGVVVASLLIHAPWYSSIEAEQATCTYYECALHTVRNTLATVQFKYKDVLIDCLQYDYALRPTCAELARQLGTLRVYASARMLARDDHDLLQLLIDEYTAYAKYLAGFSEPYIVRVHRSARMLSTFYSLKHVDIRDPKLYYCYAKAAIILSAMLCSYDDEYYPPGVMNTERYSYSSPECYYMSEFSGVMSVYERYLGVYLYDVLPAPKLIEYVNANYYAAMMDICTTLEFKLLF